MATSFAASSRPASFELDDLAGTATTTAATSRPVSQPGSTTDLDPFSHAEDDDPAFHAPRRSSDRPREFPAELPPIVRLSEPTSSTFRQLTDRSLYIAGRRYPRLVLPRRHLCSRGARMGHAFVMAQRCWLFCFAGQLCADHAALHATAQLSRVECFSSTTNVKSSTTRRRRCSRSLPRSNQASTIFVRHQLASP
jgi:hypothetical protein